MFKYLGQLLDWSYNDWTAVIHNINKAWQVWGRLGKLLQREGAERKVLEFFYHAVVQAILLFGPETWVLLATMAQRLWGAYVVFLHQVTVKNANRLSDGSWRQVTEKNSSREQVHRRSRHMWI